MYQHGPQRCSLPPYCLHVATSNVSSNNKVNKNLNGQCSEKVLFTTSGGQIWQIDREVHMATSSSKSRQERFGSRKSPIPWGIVQLAIPKEARGQEPTTHALLMQ